MVTLAVKNRLVYGFITIMTLSKVKEYDSVREMVCYCLDYSKEDIRKDVLTNGRSLIMDEIKLAKQFGGCRCDIKNPKGR